MIRDRPGFPILLVSARAQNFRQLFHFLEIHSISHTIHKKRVRDELTYIFMVDFYGWKPCRVSYTGLVHPQGVTAGTLTLEPRKGWVATHWPKGKIDLKQKTKRESLLWKYQDVMAHIFSHIYMYILYTVWMFHSFFLWLASVFDKRVCRNAAVSPNLRLWRPKIIKDPTLKLSIHDHTFMVDDGRNPAPVEVGSLSQDL